MKLKFLFYSISWMCLGGLTTQAQGPIPLNPRPSRELGHPAAAFNPLNTIPLNSNPNLVEGREFFGPGGMAMDTGANPPILWVADTGNNRVLGWNYTSALGVPSSGPFPPADYILGQPDRYSTSQGNALTNSNGLVFPYGLAIPPDGSGNLYVLDSGNNRIVRYPRGSIYPDLVIGQPSANFNLPNQGQGSTPGQNTLSLGGNIASIAFDKNGNLYVTDILNNRVLRFNASDLPPAPCSANCFGPNASLVLGQNSFNTSTAQPGLLDQTNTNLVLNGLRNPVSVAVDAQNRVYVGDTLSRVLIYPANVSANGSPAQFIAGIPPLQSTAPVPQNVKDNTLINTPWGLFVTPQGRVGVVDAGYSRIMLFQSVDTSGAWPSPQTRTGPSPQAQSGGIFPSLNANTTSVLPSHYVNAGNAEASASSLNAPSFAYVGPDNELFISDTANHRVLVMPMPTTSFSAATRVLGQDQFNFMSPNLVEGREFQFTFADQSGRHADGGIVVDQNSNPPHLYVADTYNNRILGFNDARSIKPGAQADLVIGQPDFRRTVCNYNPNTALASTNPTASSLCQPVGLALDSQGNLWVADRSNHRVLRFPAPFAQGGVLPQANLVLGQGAPNNFTGNALSPTSFASPYGVAINNDTDLVVSDAAFNRVLIYQNQAGNWVRTKVLGQPDPNSCQPATCPGGNALNQFSAPAHVAFDSSGIIYVSDFGNGRVLIFSNPSNLSNNDFAQSYSLSGLANPSGIFVNQQTGEIWVANTNGSSALRYPNLDSIVRGNTQPTVMGESINTLAVAQDQFGDLYVADASNRVVIHYPALLAVNGASQLIPTGTTNPAPLAPGVIATLCPPLRSDLIVACRPDDANQFGTDSASYTDLPNPVPLPTVLADLQVSDRHEPD
jgi:sugar lactone lactonase YvrE